MLPRSMLEMLPTVNALLNSISCLLLYVAYRHIKNRRPDLHKRYMLAAIGVSIVFLTSYLTYHAGVGSVRYPIHDWTRMVYFAILIPHTILAGLMVPFIVAAVIFAYKKNFRRHTAITKWLWPVWMFVSVTGVVVYLMLYHFAGAKAG